MFGEKKTCVLFLTFVTLTLVHMTEMNIDIHDFKMLGLPVTCL